MFLILFFLINPILANNIAVIGSGYSGLTSALALEKKNYNVEVYEKNDFLGGRAHDKFINNYKYSMGPSWYIMPDLYEDIFNYFNYSYKDFYNLDKPIYGYNLFYKNNTYKIPNSIEKFKYFLNKTNYENNETINDYFEKAHLFETLGKPLLYDYKNLYYNIFSKKYIENVFKIKNHEHEVNKFQNILTKIILSWPIIFVGNNPDKSPNLYMMLNNNIYNKGISIPYRFQNNTKIYDNNLPIKALISLAKKKAHIKFYKNHSVVNYEYKNNKIIKICFNYTKYLQQNDSIKYYYYCKKTTGVISSIDYNYHEQTMLKPQYQTYSKNYWNNRVYSPNVLLFFITTNKLIKNLNYHNYFFNERFNNNINDIFSNNKITSNYSQFYINDLNYNSYKDTHTNIDIESKKYNYFILHCVSDNYDKNALLNYTIQILKNNTNSDFDLLNVDFYDTSNFTNLFNSHKENSFGLANNYYQTLVKPTMESKIKNLVYVGQTTFPGPGVPPSMISGINGATILDTKMKNSIILINNYTLLFILLTSHFLIYNIIFLNKKWWSYLYSTYLFYNNGKTYFIASLLFEKKDFLTISSLYSFFRIADDYVDNNNDKQVRYINLYNYRYNFYKFIEGNEPNLINPIYYCVNEVIKENRFSLELFEKFFKSMFNDCQNNIIYNEVDLLEYMEGSAAVIGEFMVEIMIKDNDISYTKNNAIFYGKKLGLAFQLTNMLRDMKEDYNLGRIYIPKYYLDKYNLKFDKNGTMDYKSKKFQLFMVSMFNYIDNYYTSGNYGIKFLPKYSQNIIRFASMSYQKIHDKIIENDYNIFSSRVKVSIYEKIMLSFEILRPYEIFKITILYSYASFCNFFVNHSNYFLLLNYYAFIKIINFDYIDYKLFHILFNIPFIIQLYIINKSSYIHHKANELYNKIYHYDYLIYGILINILITIIYTTPFDNFLIKNKIWSYNEVYGTLWKIPYEEYLFFILQNLIVGLVWNINYLKYGLNYNCNSSNQSNNSNSNNSSNSNYSIINSCNIFIFMNLCLILITYNTNYKYLNYILLWSFPIFMIQLNFNKKVILSNLKLILNTILYSSAFLILVDKYAIENNIWIINNKFTINEFTDYISIIPIEEIVFFIYTSIMCTISLTLFMYIQNKIDL